MPDREKDLLAWMKNFLVMVLSFLAKWKVAATEADDMNDKIGRFETAMDVVESKLHTQQDVAKKNIAKREAKGSVRYFVNYHINGNPNVTTDQRIVCGLTVYDHTKTPADVLEIFPMLDEFSHPAIGRVKFKMVDSKHRKKAKPDHVHGTEMKYTVRAEKVDNPKHMEHSEFTAKMTATLQFDVELVGKYISVVFRFVNTRGQKGPWSPVYHIMIS
jgi:hypothetical protein